MTNWHMQLDSGRLLIGEQEYHGFDITVGASGAKSSWSELITSTPDDFFGIYYYLSGLSRTGYTYSIDIGIGSSGNEVSLIEELMLPIYANTANYREGVLAYLPFFIPAGSNLHGRGRSSYSSAGDSIWGGILGAIDNPFQSFMAAKSQTLNIDTTTPVSRSIDPGVTVDTWGSWADVQDGPLSLDAKFVLICINGGTDTARASAFWRFQLGMGGSGSEQPIIEFGASCNTASDRILPHYLWYPVNIPSGTTLRNRAMCIINDTGDRLINVSYTFFE